MKQRPVVITGFMAAGKTSVARALAGQLRCAATDLDEKITSVAQRTPGELITQEGEAAFRHIETKALRQSLEEGARVIALGGGAWTIPDNRKLIADFDCLTVWLDTPFELCWKRIITAGADRPLARNQEQARALYHLRQPLYELAKLRIEARDDVDANELARRLAALMIAGNV
jgi:shikimate kinase